MIEKVMCRAYSMYVQNEYCILAHTHKTRNSSNFDLDRHSDIRTSVVLYHSA